jgi:biopolymer transport protein ExbD
MGDVALCLLLGFLLVTPIIIETMPADLPQPGGASAGQARQDPVVVYTADRKLLIDGTEVGADQLGEKIASLFPPGALVERKVLFTGAGEVPYDEIIGVLDRLREAGVETIGVR